MSIIFTFPEYEEFAKRTGDFIISRFPDGESLITLKTDVKDKDVIVVCGLENADAKILPLIFFTSVVRELGAKSVGLVAPYLGYLRQDKRFESGQAVTSIIFAKFLSSLVDSIITLDPHLHRYKSLDEIYTVPTTVLHASKKIGEWIKENVKNPVIIGPDQESRQWVQKVAEQIDAPFVVLKKTRRGDKDVEVSVPDVDKHKLCTPVLIDDIISTAQTMIKTVKHLGRAGMKPTVCIGIHAIFAGDSYKELKSSGVEKIVTTNTILHETNEIDVTSLFAKILK